MLQIIGWLGCVYLVVKGLELLSSNAHRSPDGQLNNSARVGAVVALLGAVAFVAILNSRASASPFDSGSSSLSSSGGYETLTTDVVANDLDAIATDAALAEAEANLSMPSE